jgi:hypothetical protein
MTEDMLEETRLFFEFSAVSGSFVLDQVSRGAPLVEIRFAKGGHDLMLRAIEKVDGKYKVIPRPLLKFPILSAHFLLWTVRPEAATELQCSGSDCGLCENFWAKPPNDTWPSQQKIRNFNFEAQYKASGLSLTVGGTIEQIDRSFDKQTGHSAPPDTFDVSVNIAWDILPYLFERTPPFFEERRQVLGSPN